MPQLVLPIDDPAILRIGVDTIKPDPEVAIMRVGFYIVGRAGRDTRGRFASVRRILLPEYTTTDPETREYIFLPSLHRERKRAPLARVVAILAMLVVVQVRRVSYGWLTIRAVGRVLWCAVAGRPGRIYRDKQPWGSIWRDGVAAFA